VAIRYFSSFSGARQHHVSLIAWGLALAFAAWVVADLFWRLLAPHPAVFPILSESDPVKSAQVIGARHFMGEGAAPLAGGGDNGRFALFGVVTGDERHPGFAVLGVDGATPTGVLLGQEIAPGVVLTRILADRVELRSGTETQSLLLPPAGSGPAVPAAPVSVLPPPAPPQAPDISMSQPPAPAPPRGV